MMVDKTMGLIKVSRKRLLDRASPDTLKAEAPEPRTHRVIGAVGAGTGAGATSLGPGGLPTFPMSPPRKFSKEYFRLE
jgi:uncharacterized membrane protein YfcA